MFQSSTQQSNLSAKTKKRTFPKSLVGHIQRIAYYIHDRIYAVNNSKIFAGIVIIVLNISSKFVNIKLSKTMESYLKNTFSRDILIFAMAWMGTRDIYVAIFMTMLFILCINYLFNEQSSFCCLPENFTDYHLSLTENALSNETVTNEDVEKAKDVLSQAVSQGLDVGTIPSTGDI